MKSYAKNAVTEYALQIRGGRLTVLFKCHCDLDQGRQLYLDQEVNH